ncbi:acyl-CoA N-acyltransferase [Daedaleopsis nitida]|nr:acyl-CoA N-acyltransferase [Daedaleopsis nitida]
MANLSKALRAANKATVAQITSAAAIPNNVTLRELDFTVRVARPSDLSLDDKEKVWMIYETNMRALLEPSSMGWDAEEKRETLFDEDSRFIIVYHRQSTENTDSMLVAFSMFRFEFGYEEDDTIYCYEMQVSDGFRGYGLCRFFVEKLNLIGKYWKMEKILLTVLKENTSARQVYTKLGFVVDPASPEHGEEGERSGEEVEEADYEILSISLL